MAAAGMTGDNRGRKGKGAGGSAAGLLRLRAGFRPTREEERGGLSPKQGPSQAPASPLPPPLLAPRFPGPSPSAGPAAAARSGLRLGGRELRFSSPARIPILAIKTKPPAAGRLLTNAGSGPPKGAVPPPQSSAPLPAAGAEPGAPPGLAAPLTRTRGSVRLVHTAISSRMLMSG